MRLRLRLRVRVRARARARARARVGLGFFGPGPNRGAGEGDRVVLPKEVGGADSQQVPEDQVPIDPPPVRPASEAVGRGRGQPLLEHPAVERLEVRQALGARELSLDPILVGEVRVGSREAWAWA